MATVMTGMTSQDERHGEPREEARRMRRRHGEPREEARRMRRRHGEPRNQAWRTVQPGMATARVATTILRLYRVSTRWGGFIFRRFQVVFSNGWDYHECIAVFAPTQVHFELHARSNHAAIYDQKVPNQLCPMSRYNVTMLLPPMIYRLR